MVFRCSNPLHYAYINRWKSAQPLSFKSKDKRKCITIRDLLFTDDAVVAAHRPSHFQSLMDRFDNACKNLDSLSTSKKSPSTSNHIASITINNSHLEELIYLEPTMNSKLSFNKKIVRWISRTSSSLPWNKCVKSHRITITQHWCAV